VEGGFKKKIRAGQETIIRLRSDFAQMIHYILTPLKLFGVFPDHFRNQPQLTPTISAPRS
jgi:hypothetical protein